MGYIIPGRETVQGALLDKCFGINIKNQREKLINRADIYGLHFKGDGATIKETPLLNILLGGVHLPLSVQNIVECTGHITSIHNKDAKCVAESFFDTTNGIDPEKKLVNLHTFNGSIVCINARKIEGCISYSVTYFGIREYLP